MVVLFRLGVDSWFVSMCWCIGELEVLRADRMASVGEAQQNIERGFRMTSVGETQQNLERGLCARITGLRPQ